MLKVRLGAPAAKQSSRRLRVIAAAGALAAAIAGAYLFIPRTQPTAPFEAMRMERLQTRGQPSSAAISSSGKLLGYVEAGKTGSTLWLRNLENSEERALLPNAPGAYNAVLFSPDEAPEMSVPPETLMRAF